MIKKPSAITEVIARIQPGQRVFIHGAAATPNALIRELVAQASRLHQVEIIHLHTEGPANYAAKELQSSFRVVNLFVGSNMRAHLNDDQIDYLPCFLSEIPSLFSSKRRPIDVALISLSQADAHGYHTLGTSVDVARSAADLAPTLLAQINRQMPKTHGDGYVHSSRLTAACEVNEPLPEVACAQISPLEATIGRNVASLIDDGACLQAGIGAIPNATLAALKSHRNLGLHTEMASDGVLALIQSGVINNSRKRLHSGKSVLSFLLGTRELYRFVDDNPSVVLLAADYVNSVANIAQNDQVVAINSAVEIDLTGQVCADSIGPKIISGVGGQMDFMRGAALSKKGKAILALTSRTKHDRSRIVATLTPGAGVVTTRAHVQYVVTEYGIADLIGKTLGERARALIAIAHPDDRDSLGRAWRARTDL
ncbi:4-hydroxybutyrate CoA-transferase [bacterium]|nr:4-hydroxybutyrate CoA-transferase [bacterium]